MTDPDKPQIDETNSTTEEIMINLKNICDCRLAMGVVVAVLLIGSYVLMTAINSPTLQTLPLLIFLVCLVVAIGGIWLLYSSSHKSKGGCSRTS